MQLLSAVRAGLLVTAPLNLVAGLAAVVAPELAIAVLYTGPVTLDPLLLRHHILLWLFVAAMGVGYAIAATDPARHTALLVCGGLGKLAAVAVWLEMLRAGLGNWPMWAGVLTDGTLGVLFLTYVARGSR